MMAYADYRLCDVCGGKAFYDANLNYEHGIKDPDWEYPFRTAGEPQHDNPKYQMRLDYLGDWAVICSTCAATHKTVVMPISEPRPDTGVVTEAMVERVAVGVADQWFGPNKYRDAWDDYHRNQWVRVFRESLAGWPVITVSDALVEVASRAAHATKVPEHGIEWDYCGSHTQDEWRKAIRAALTAALRARTTGVSDG